MRRRSSPTPAQRVLGGASILVAGIAGVVVGKLNWGFGWKLLTLAAVVTFIVLAGFRAVGALGRGHD
jgi:hypothetical protein